MLDNNVTLHNSYTSKKIISISATKPPLIDRIRFSNIVNYLLKDPILDWFNLHASEFTHIRDSNDYNNFIQTKADNFRKYHILKLSKSISRPIPNISTKIYIETTHLKRDFYTNMVACYKKRETVVDMLVKGELIKNYFKSKSFNINDNRYYIIKVCYVSNLVRKNNKLSNSIRGRLLKYRLHYDYSILKALYNVSNDVILIFRRTLKNTDRDWFVYTISDQCLSIKDKIEKSISWYRYFTKNYQKYNIVDSPYKKTLLPNMKNSHDYPWKTVKSKIALHNKEITLIWGLGLHDRQKLYKNFGITSWKHIEKHMLNYKSDKYVDKIMGIININRGKVPIKISKNINLTRGEREVFIDFELFTNIFSEDFKNANRDNFVFMIGALYVDNTMDSISNVSYKYYVAKYIELNEEKRIFSEFFSDIDCFTKGHEIPLYHWGHIENYTIKNAIQFYNITLSKSIKFIDLNQLFKFKGIYIKGAYNYSLKSIGKALLKKNIINTSWDDLENGMDAMVICYNIYKNKCNNRKKQLEDIIKYNYIDVKVLYDIVIWLDGIS